MYLNVHMMLDSVEATKHMVARGLGISFLPSRSIRREVELGAIAYGGPSSYLGHSGYGAAQTAP